MINYFRLDITSFIDLQKSIVLAFSYQKISKEVVEKRRASAGCPSPLSTVGHYF
jgi:hypothetical protein